MECCSYSLHVYWPQRSGGTIPEAQARSLLVGIGPAIPPPTLTGLPLPRQSVTQQTWQAAPQACPCLLLASQASHAASISWHAAGCNGHGADQ